MTTKLLLKIGIAIGLLALLLVFLGVNYVPRSTAFPFARESDLNTAKYAGSDWIERHPSNYYAGSDWIERHPSVIRPANYYAGSDWIERHPSVVRPANYYTGSDWIERHPSNYYSNSDWFERHPDLLER